MTIIRNYKNRYKNRENTLYNFYLKHFSHSIISTYLYHTKIKRISIHSILCYPSKKNILKLYYITVYVLIGIYN